MSETDVRLTKSHAALAELERSLARLEKALKARKTEHALVAELAAARAEYERMVGTVRAVETRLRGGRGRPRRRRGGWAPGPPPPRSRSSDAATTSPATTASRTMCAGWPPRSTGAPVNC